MVDPEISSSGQRVSAVVVNFNSGQYLLDCVGTALMQVDEVFVVDNASADNSLDLLLAKFPNEPRLKTVRNKKNFGFAKACNIGHTNATSDIVLFLNPDCSLENEAISRLAAVLNSDKSIGMVGGLLLNENGSEQGGSRRAVPTPWRSFVRAFGLHRFANRWPRLFYDFHLHRQPLPASHIEVEAISGACMMVKREAIADIGPWDEGYFLHCEDLDLCMRMRQRNWKIMFVPSARIVHVRGVCGSNRPVFVTWHKHKGMVRFYRKFFRHQYPLGLMGLVAVGVWLRFGLVATYHSVKHIGRMLGVRRD